MTSGGLKTTAVSEGYVIRQVRPQVCKLPDLSDL